MLDWLKRKKTDPSIASQWYGLLIGAAREPKPFAEGWVDDTLDGRFQMVTLVSTLIMRRLRTCGAGGKALADAIYKQVFSGFDHALREEGVGDSSIARRIRKMGETFFGLARAVDAALETSDPQTEVCEVLTRNVQPNPDRAEALAVYLITLNASIEQASDQDMLNATPAFTQAFMQD